MEEIKKLYWLFSANASRVLVLMLYLKFLFIDLIALIIIIVWLSF